MSTSGESTSGGPSPDEVTSEVAAAEPSTPELPAQERDVGSRSRRTKWLIGSGVAASVLVVGGAIAIAVVDEHEGGKVGRKDDQSSSTEAQRDGRSNRNDQSNGDSAPPRGERSDRRTGGDRGAGWPDGQGNGPMNGPMERQWGANPSTDGPTRNGSNGSSGSNPGRTQPTVVPGGGANGEDILVWPDGRIVTLPGRALTPSTTATPVPN